MAYSDISELKLYRCSIFNLEVIVRLPKFIIIYIPFHLTLNFIVWSVILVSSGCKIAQNYLVSFWKATPQNWVSVVISGFVDGSGESLHCKTLIFTGFPFGNPFKKVGFPKVFLGVLESRKPSIWLLNKVCVFFAGPCNPPQEIHRWMLQSTRGMISLSIISGNWISFGICYVQLKSLSER